MYIIYMYIYIYIGLTRDHHGRRGWRRGGRTHGRGARAMIRFRVNPDGFV